MFLLQARRARHTVKAALEREVNLPEQPSAKRVGSSLVNMMTSMPCRGRKPAACNACSAAMPPITPSVPSYAPASGMASVCEPVCTWPTAWLQKGAQPQASY